EVLIEVSEGIVKRNLRLPGRQVAFFRRYPADNRRRLLVQGSTARGIGDPVLRYVRNPDGYALCCARFQIQESFTVYFANGREIVCVRVDGAQACGTNNSQHSDDNHAEGQYRVSAIFENLWFFFARHAL